MVGMQIPQEQMRQGVQMGYYPNYQKVQTPQEIQNSPPCMQKDAPQDLHKGHCACIPQETSIDCVRLAQAYVPFQKFCGMWPPLRSLLAGTIFPELYSPYRKMEYVNLEPEVTCSMCQTGGGCR